MGKRRRQLPLSDGHSDSDTGLDPTPAPASMETEPHLVPLPSSANSSLTDALPGADLRSSSDHARTTDPRSSTDLARSHDPCSSSDPARSPDQRPTLADATAHRSVERSPEEPYLSPLGSYVVVKPCDTDVSFRKINVFWPQKQVAAICGPCAVEIEAPADGSLVIKTNNRKDTKALLKTTTFCGKQVTVSLHKGRNSCKGTVFAPELRHMSEDGILSDLKGDGVTHIRRLTTFRDGQRRDTSLLVLTFDSTTLPEKISIGWLRKEVRVFIPNPLRCYKCQRFGHGSSACRQTARCQKCGEAPHEGSDCTSPTSCLSCGSCDHLVSSSQCPVWKEEKRICELKAKSGLSYPEARRQVKAENVTPTPGKTYAKAATVQTASCSTQTEPLDVLPPLQLLTPLASSAAASTNTAQEPMVQDHANPTTSSPSDSQPESVESPTVGKTSKPVADATLPSRAWNKTKSKASRLPPPPYPARDGQSTSRQSRPSVRIAMGHNRSSSWAPPSAPNQPSNTST